VFDGVISESPLTGGTDSPECDNVENRDIGLAISTTPNSETYAAICSIRVKGSLMRKEHAQHARLGARKVMTVASARGRYNRESVRC
jgi:hypothetical protein